MMVKEGSRSDGGALLSRVVRVQDVPAGGLAGRLEADAGERAAIAEQLDLVALDALALTYELTPIGSGRLRLTGTLSADGTQRCVISLEAVPAAISEPVNMEFWPLEALRSLEQAHSGDAVELALEGPEPIEGAEIDLGQLAYEILAASLDPYPRKAGAAFVWEGAAEGGDTAGAGPFAALKALKQRDK